MSKITRREMMGVGMAGTAVIAGGTADAASEKETLLSIEEQFLPAQLTREKIAAGNGVTFTQLEYEGATYSVGICDFLGGGVPHSWIAIYAPDKEGVFHRCLLAESWAAGHVKASIDAKTGLLELREAANSKLKGEVVLACNLRTIGTYHTVVES